MGTNAALDGQPNFCWIYFHLFKRGFIQEFGALQLHAAQLCPACRSLGMDRNLLPEGGVVRGEAMGVGSEQGRFIGARDGLDSYKAAQGLLQTVF